MRNKKSEDFWDDFWDWFYFANLCLLGVFAIVALWLCIL